MAVGAGRIFAINLLANSKPAEDAFKKVGQAAGRIPTPMKVAAAAITAVFAAVAVVATKSFKALLELGGEFNEVTRIIRVGTGAVGGDLEALEQSFRNVAGAVPSAFADVAAVVAELDTRTDLAGDGLEVMAEQLLTLSRLMGGDARTTTREVTRLFNRFGLEAEAASDMLDLLFRASQASGAEVGQLAADVTKNAGALVGMGLSLEESIALFALFEREGVRSRTVVSALQSGMAKLTKDGALPLNEALAATFEELRTLDREAAVAKGLDIFGASALELIDAVRDGRLDVAAFTKTLLDGEDTIIGVAEETDGWREALAKVRNDLKLKFEPIAREVFKEVTAAVDGLIPAADRVEKAFEEEGLKGAFRQLGAEMKLIYENTIKPIFDEQLIPFLNDVVKPALIEFGTEAGLAIGRALWAAIKTGLKNALLGDPLDKTFTENLKDQILGRGAFDSGSSGGRLFSGGMPSLPSPAPRPPLPGSLFVVPPPRPPTPAPSSSQPNLTFVPDFGFVPLATGGIVTSPTLALIGEAGPEAVIPLDRAGGMGGQTFVTINVTGADPQAVVEALRRYTRANGPLGSVVNV